jgi:3D (Asp-Asp-Asp) domain-containing protein
MSSGPASAAVALALFFAPAASAAAPPVEKVGRASLSFYWIIDECSAEYRGRADVLLRDVRGHVLARTTHKFRRALVLEGIGWLRDGRAVMYDRKRDGEHRFRIAKERNGLTVTGCALVPFRTAAVDPRVIKLGSRIYIPQLRGTRLPDGTIHDGVFIASDRGHFRGKHVDLFVGQGARGARPFVRRGYASRSHVTVYLLQAGTNACGG